MATVRYVVEEWIHLLDFQDNVLMTPAHHHALLTASKSSDVLESVVINEFIYFTTIDIVTYLVKEGVHLQHYNSYSDVLGEGMSPSTAQQWTHWRTWYRKESIYCTTMAAVTYLAKQKSIYCTAMATVRYWQWNESTYCTTVATVKYLVKERDHILPYNGHSEVLGKGLSPPTALQWLQTVTYLVEERVHLLHYNGYSDVLGEVTSPSTALQ